jgi:hypothetical protein
MDHRPDVSKAKRFPWWVAVVGPALGVLTARAMWQFYPPMNSAVRDTLVVGVAILIAAFLAYSIYRFIRM